MKTLKKIFRLFLNKVFFKKVIAYIILVLLVLILKDFALVLFLTFLFSYLFLTFWNFLKQKIDCLTDKVVNDVKTRHFFKNMLSTNVIIIFLYLVFISLLFFSVSDMIPKLTKEFKDLPRYVPALWDYFNTAAIKLEEFKNINSQIWGTLSEIFSKQDLDIIMQVYAKLKTVWTVFFKVFLSLILSYIFILDRDKLLSYLKWVEESNFWFLYKEYNIIIQKIVKTFGLVFKAQSIIALTNALLTTLWLLIIWIVNWAQFPFIYSLAIIVFICSFIPVLGTFISSFPILIIWYTKFGWIAIVFEIIALISIIHALEAYYLNPKIVSSFIHLPVSLTFLVLILSEHFMWFAWLVIWISSFYLALELLKDVDVIITNSRQTLKKMTEVEEATHKEIKKDIRLSRKV